MDRTEPERGAHRGGVGIIALVDQQQFALRHAQCLLHAAALRRLGLREGKRRTRQVGTHELDRRKHGKATGRLVPDVATGADYNAKGFDFICYSGDVWAYQAAVKAGVDGIRAACGAA